MSLSANNPTAKVMKQLELEWMEFTAKATPPLTIWRVPASGESLLDGFLALQQHPEGRSQADMFISLTLPFETGYSYSQALAREFVESCEATPESKEWQAEQWLPCYSANQLVLLLEDFASHFSENLRQLILVLKPSSVSEHHAFEHWLEQWIRQPVSRVRLLLTDTSEQPTWQAFCQTHHQQARILHSEPDMLPVMQQTARQQTDSDPDRLLYRRYIADTMVLLEKGSAEQIAQRAGLALAIAQRRGWADQQVIIHNLTAGGWLKQQSTDRAVEQYRLAQRTSTEISDPAIRPQLLIQSTMGEAGAWFSVKEYQRAAQLYRQAAQQAQQIPHPFFAIEGFRMAGFCLSRGHHNTAAIQDYASAIGAAKGVTEEEREQTSLPLVFQNLLQLHDQRRAEALEKCAEQWLKEKKNLTLEAEVTASQLQRPDTSQIRQIDNRLQLKLEAAFISIRQQREAIIQQGDSSFKSVIRLAREQLHAHWNGLPAIAHPFDAPPAEWQDLPEWQHSQTTENPILSEEQGQQTT